MIEKLIVVGDLHLRDKKPYYSQVLDILEWLFNSEYNNNKNQLILLGDLVEKINATYELMEVYIDYFLNKSKFDSIKILKGNHDSALLKDSNDNTTHSTVLSVFKPLKNVEVIEYYKVQEPTPECPIRLLYLPHYDHEGTNKESMIETYSNLHTKVDGEFDFCFHHVEDETNHFSNSYCDLSKLKVKQYLAGHIHSENLTTGGRYLGSPGFNSSGEATKTPYIATIDVSTKKHTLIPVPKLIEYLTVTYPEKLPESNSKYPIYTILESLDKKETIDFYTKQASERNQDLYVRRIFIKRHNAEVLKVTEDSSNVEKSLFDYFESYSIDNKLSNEIKDICVNFLHKILDKV